MKKLIFAVFLIIAVSVGFSFAQTKRRTVRKAPVKKAVTAPVVRQQAVTTASGLTYIITKRGTGAQVKAGDQVEVNYTGLLTNGMQFDSSLNRGVPISFPVGAGRVIKGWDEGLQKLRVGDHATFIIPASIAYGSRGRDPIPPDATLIFIIEVVDLKRKLTTK